jgi:hypothetical protein
LVQGRHTLKAGLSLKKIFASTYRYGPLTSGILAFNMGLSTRFVSAFVNYIRRNFEKCLTQASDFSEQLTNSENASRDPEKAAK